MKDYSSAGYAMSSEGLLQEVEAQIRLDNPTWDDDKVDKEMDKVFKDASLYNQYNKKPKKAKKAKKDSDYVKKPKKDK